MSSKILLRRGTAAQWSSANPILGIGELGIETDTLKIKIGNGTSTWTQLTSYANVTPAQLTSEINNLISAAPATLDTLNELAAAINNDASFSTTVNNLLTGKVSKSGGDTITASTASTIGLIIKGAASQTADLQQWQNSAGAVQVSIKPTSNSTNVLKFTQDHSFAINWGDQSILSTSLAYLVISPYGPERRALVVKGLASQTGNLQEWHNSASTQLASVSSDGTATLGSMYITAGTHKAYGPFEILNNGTGNSEFSIIGFGTSSNNTLTIGIKNTDNANNRNWKLSVGGGGYAGQSGNFLGEGGLLFTENNPNDSSSVNRGGFRRGGQFALGGINTYSASLSVTPLSTSTVGQIIRANASQTADLQQWQNSTGTTLLSVSPDGYLNKTGTVYIGPTLQFADPGVGNETKFIFTKSTDGAYLTVKERASDQTFYEFGMNDNALDGGDYFQWANGQWSGPGYGWMPLQLGSNSGKNQTLRFVGEQSIFWSPVSTPVNSPYFTYLAENSASTNYEVSKWAPGNGSGTNIRRLESSGSTATFNIDISGYTYASRMGYRIAIDSGATTFSYTTYGGDNSSGSAIAINAGNWVTLSNGLKIRIGSGALAGENWSFLAFPTPRVGIGGATDTSALGIIRPSATDKGLIIKGAESQTANLQEWQNSSGTALVSVSSVGNFYVGNTFSNFGGQTNNAGYVTIAGSLPALKPLVIRGAASQTANLTEWQNSDGTVKARIDSNGNFVLESTLAYLGTTSAYVGVGASNGMRAHAGSASVVPWQVIGAASQTANLQEWQNSAGSVQAKITSDGQYQNQYGITLAANIVVGSGSGPTGYPVISIQNVSSAPSSNPTGGGNIYVENGSLKFRGSGGVTAQFEAYAATDKPLIVKGAASQSADLQQWQNSSGAVLAEVDSLGNVIATDYKLSNSLYNIKKTIKKTIDPAQNAIAGNTYDLFQVAFAQSLQGIFTMQVSIRNAGYGQSMSYTLPVTYAMDWLSQYGITNPFTDSTTWVDLTPITFAPRHLMTNDYLKFQARVSNNTIFFRIKLTGQLTLNPLFDVYIQHSEEFANSTVTELSSTGTDFTTSGVLPNFLSSKAGTTAIFNPLTITSSVAANVPLTIKGTSSQSANLQQWQNSDSISIAQISATGTISTKPVAFSGNLNTPIISVTDRGATWTPGNFAFRSDSGGIPRFSFTGPNASTEALTINGNSVGVQTPSPSAVFQVTSNAAGSIATIIKGAASQTANLQEWQDSSGTVLANVNSSGSFTINNLGVGGTLGATVRLIVTSSGAGNVVSMFRGAASQTADLQQWQDSAATVLTKVNAYGRMTINSTVDAGGAALYVFQPNGGYGVRVLGAGTSGAALWVDTVAGGVGQIIRGAASQTANLQEWQDSAGTVLANVDSSGKIAAPIFQSTTGGTAYIVTGSNNNAIRIQTNANANVGLQVRGEASQTADLQQWQDSAGTVMGRIDGQYGTIRSISGIDLTNTHTGSPTITARVNYPNTIPIVIVGAASQTANLQQWQNSAGTVLAKVAADGQLSVGNGTSNYLSTYDAYGNITSRTAGTNYSANISVLTGATSYIGMVIRGQASQTANLQEWQNSAGDVVAALAINTEGGSQNATLKLQGAYGGIISNGEWSITRYGGDLQMLAPTNYLVRTVYAGSFIIRGAASQTANLQEWQNVGGTVLAKITASGALDVTAITVNGAAITSTPTTSDVELMNIMGAY